MGVKPNIGGITKVSLDRWNRLASAERRTPWLLQKEPRLRDVKLLRMGTVRVLDWGDGPRLDPGTGIVYAVSAIELMRVPTPADAEAIERARQVVADAEVSLQELRQKVYRRGRKPTLDEVRAAAEQVKAEVGR